MQFGKYLKCLKMSFVYIGLSSIILMQLSKNIIYAYMYNICIRIVITFVFLINFNMIIGKIMIIVYNRYYADIQPLSNQSVKKYTITWKTLIKE